MLLITPRGHTALLWNTIVRFTTALIVQEAGRLVLTVDRWELVCMSVYLFVWNSRWKLFYGQCPQTNSISVFLCKVFTLRLTLSMELSSLKAGGGKTTLTEYSWVLSHQHHNLLISVRVLIFFNHQFWYTGIACDHSPVLLKVSPIDFVETQVGVQYCSNIGRSSARLFVDNVDRG